MDNSKTKHSGTFFSLFTANYKEALNTNNASFTQELFYLIDTKGLTDVEVYSRARIDRKLFSKIRKNGYIPKKKTIIQLILALELSYTEGINLLNLAGYTLSQSPSMPFDIIITNAITSNVYNIDDINEILYKFQLPLLGD